MAVNLLPIGTPAYLGLTRQDAGELVVFLIAWYVGKSLRDEEIKYGSED